MHFEFLVEDKSGEQALRLLIPKILGNGHTYNVHAYRGIGHLPKGLKTIAEPQHRALLSQLPRLLRGYGVTFRGYPPDYRAVVVLICDLDRECRHDLRLELLNLLHRCDPRPETYFCIAEEEGEAWLLGDAGAIKRAYPDAKLSILDDYVQDSTCGTWEVLADVVYPGGAKSLKTRQYFEIGAVKCSWAKQIGTHLDINSNSSPSFLYFRNKLRRLAAQSLHPLTIGEEVASGDSQVRTSIHGAEE